MSYASTSWKQTSETANAVDLGRSPLHPIPITRFRSFRTQPLENVSAAVKLPINKKGFWHPNPSDKYCEEKYCDGNWV